MLFTNGVSSNSLTLHGLPQHKLNTKLGAPVMLLCSTVDPASGHCNDTGYTSSVASCADTSQHALHAANIQAMSY